MDRRLEAIAGPPFAQQAAKGSMPTSNSGTVIVVGTFIPGPAESKWQNLLYVSTGGVNQTALVYNDGTMVFAGGSGSRLNTEQFAFWCTPDLNKTAILNPVSVSDLRYWNGPFRGVAYNYQLTNERIMRVARWLAQQLPPSPAG